ncbi:MAG TPA: hypothetical protein VKR53_15035 [Puia sp.]|nr:hypothetical protein [Puia sp.]
MREHATLLIKNKNRSWVIMQEWWVNINRNDGTTGIHTLDLSQEYMSCHNRKCGTDNLSSDIKLIGYKLWMINSGNSGYGFTEVRDDKRSF